MLGKWKRSDGTLYGVLLDIGSGTIGVAIVKSDLNEKLPVILYEDRTTMRVSTRTKGGEESLRRVREMLLSSALTLSQEGLSALRAHDENARISELSVTVSAPWSSTLIHHVAFNDDEPFRVTPALLKDLVASAESEMLATSRKAGNGAASAVVERATTQIAVNDYPVTDPFRTEGNILTLSHVAGLIPETIMGTIYEIQEKLFPKTRLHAHTSMLSVFSVVHELFPRVSDFCVVDVTAEATEFGIVENGMLVENTFIPSGTNSFTRTVLEKTGKPLSDLESSLRTFGKEITTEDEKLLAFAEEYGKELRSGILRIEEKRILPLKFVVTAHHPYGDLMRHVIREALKETTGKKPSLLSVDQHLLDEISHGAGEDVYLALHARFFHTLHGKEKRG